MLHGLTQKQARSLITWYAGERWDIKDLDGRTKSLVPVGRDWPTGSPSAESSCAAGHFDAGDSVDLAAQAQRGSTVRNGAPRRLTWDPEIASSRFEPPWAPKRATTSRSR